MSWLQALIAGIIQGATEFLPISSSGHLVIYDTLFGEGADSGLAFKVFLHLATLLAVLIVFYKDVWMLIKEFFKALADIIKGKPDFKSPERRFLLMVIIATIPALLAGAAVKLLDLDSILENIFVVASMLIITALFMFIADKLNKGKYAEADAPYKSSLLVGILQAIAILPGLSRSGSTIFGGLIGGLKREFAVKFAFILSIPAILGAGLVELAGVVRGGDFSVDIVGWVIGFATALILGVLSIKFIRVLIKSNRFYIFGVYCLLVSALAFLTGFGVIRV